MLASLLWGGGLVPSIDFTLLVYRSPAGLCVWCYKLNNCWNIPEDALKTPSVRIQKIKHNFKYFKWLAVLFKKPNVIGQGFESLLGSSYYTSMLVLGASVPLPELWSWFSRAPKCGVSGSVGCQRIICAFQEETKIFSPFLHLYIHSYDAFRRKNIEFCCCFNLYIIVSFKSEV